MAKRKALVLVPDAVRTPAKRAPAPTTAAASLLLRLREGTRSATAAAASPANPSPASEPTQPKKRRKIYDRPGQAEEKRRRKAEDDEIRRQVYKEAQAEYLEAARTDKLGKGEMTSAKIAARAQARLPPGCKPISGAALTKQCRDGRVTSPKKTGPPPPLKALVSSLA